MEISPINRKELRSFIKSFCLDGECYAFAIAFSRGTGWPIYGLMKNGIIRHVAVKGPSCFWDGRGPFCEKKFGEPFSISSPYELRVVTEEELKAIRPDLNEIKIDFISRICGAAWPKLSWKENTFIKRILSFAQDLEEASKKHNLWIFGPVPNIIPLITNGCGDESYSLGASLDGSSFSINRQIGKSTGY
ncbi:MAG: hypothetical protein WC435_01520 [Candidatus Paceibacterota bacterium]